MKYLKIYDDDIKSLNYKQWVSDSIIDYYILEIFNKKAKNLHCFNKYVSKYAAIHPK